MFDIGWSEMLVIGVVALIVVGPKDLPKMFHTLGQAMGKARGMAREFQRAMDAAARESGVNDIRKAATGQTLREAVGLDDIEKEFRDIGHDRPAVRAAPGTPAPRRVEPDESAGDEAEIAALDADLARRNAEFSHTEALRLQKAEQAATIRQQAADLRARSEAAARKPPEPPASRAAPAAAEAPARPPSPSPAAAPAPPLNPES